MSSVLIGPAEYLSDLSAQEGPDATFADTDALEALQVILRQTPTTVLLEHSFAATSRGIALVNRITGDPSLRQCEIRVVSLAGPAQPPAVSPAPPEQPPVCPPLDAVGTQQAPRTALAADAQALVDGRVVTVVDLSVAGAQVIAPITLRPGQRVRIAFPDATPPLRLSATVAWAVFEMPEGKPHYRAGLQFLGGDAAAIDRFRAAHQA